MSVPIENTLTQENKKIKKIKTEQKEEEKWLITFFFNLNIEKKNEEDSFNLELKNGLELDMPAITVKGYIEHVIIGTYEEAEHFQCDVTDCPFGNNRKKIVDSILKKYFENEEIEYWEMNNIELNNSIEKYHED